MKLLTQPDPKFEEIGWSGDPAASGYRYRAWVASPNGEPAELCVYEKDGDWCLGFPRTQYQWMATGHALDFEDGKRRVYLAWLAMRDAPPKRASS